MAHRTVATSCLACTTPMVVEERLGTTFERCETCRGVWIHPQAFFSLLRHFQPQLRIDEAMVHNDGSPRRPCPVCREVMDIAWLDFLQLDQCSTHGLWFDGDELERALAGDIGTEVQKQLARARQQREQRAHPSQAGMFAGILAGNS